ncbi:Protein kinase-like domain [Pseudocohnilembus persalinus]|uniref:Protein kinase-like domain n=1 Tax=Pseudocohnilembus persalinus TaxID=266149 RepID=A0A0V0QJB8_PSEPJ|nr:Protein kinase-like domain [Pseudocohnilembus persalinus]|eukprot:KRX02399.1 Protein kinase-like domain [Pseudocohnilembus persalinus]
MSDNTLKKIDRFQFSLKDSIGIGSFGQVYKGKEEKTHRPVAVKMISKQKIQKDEYLMNGLFSEIQVMKKLKSEYVVELIEVLETSNNYYIIQELCDSGDLRHILKKKKNLSEQEALQVLKDLLSGFTELLKNGIIHRDLKPENILCAKGKFKLADFGFARAVENFNRAVLESLVGTPLYMSPQILKHETYGTKSDIWSLALIYYEMLIGSTPWKARSQYELVKKIDSEKITFPDNIIISQEIQRKIQL